MTIRDRTLDFVYSGSQVSEIRNGGSTVLTITRDPLTQEVTGMAFKGGAIEIEKGSRPEG